MKTRDKKRNWMKRLTAVAVILAMLLTPAFAAPNGIANSTIGQGVNNLINDLSAYMVLICPTLGAAMAGYYMARRQVAEEDTDKAMWRKKAVGAIITGVAGMLVSGVVTLISGYFV